MPITTEPRTITITIEQGKWLDDNHISLSALVQDAIDSEMDKFKKVKK